MNKIKSTEPSARQVSSVLKDLSTQERAKSNAWYFKTGRGEYGEGDKFLGVSMPDIRKVAKRFAHLPIAEVLKLLKSKYHEERMTALIVLVIQFESGDERQKERIFNIYLNNTCLSGRQAKYINNWDLVDVTTPRIVGAYLYSLGVRDAKWKVLNRLVRSKNLWERRISVLATFPFISRGEHEYSLKIADILLSDTHDLIHKAVGWMLREVGKRDREVLEKFLKLPRLHSGQARYKKMPRTMLRYALEKFPRSLYKKYLGRSI